MQQSDVHAVSCKLLLADMHDPFHCSLIEALATLFPGNNAVHWMGCLHTLAAAAAAAAAHENTLHSISLMPSACPSHACTN
jgi:hypothetical protein